MGPLATALLLVAANVPLPLAPSEAPYRSRIAVVMLGATASDVDVADNLTEVIIARLAQRGHNDIVGTMEFRRRLGLEDAQQERHCLDTPACVDRVAVSLGAAQVLSGTISSQPTRRQYTYGLSLRNINAGEIQARIWRSLIGTLSDLVRSVNRATDELLTPKPVPARFSVASSLSGARVVVDDVYFGTTPKALGTLAPGRHRVRVEAEGRRRWASEVDARPAATIDLRLTEFDLPPRPQWPRPVAYGLATGAILSLTAGIVLGVLANVTPVAPDRAEAQRDFEQRRRIGALANGLFVTSGALAIGAGAVLWTQRREIFDRDH